MDSNITILNIRAIFCNVWYFRRGVLLLSPAPAATVCISRSSFTGLLPAWGGGGGSVFYTRIGPVIDRSAALSKVRRHFTRISFIFLKQHMHFADGRERLIAIFCPTGVLCILTCLCFVDWIHIWEVGFEASVTRFMCISLHRRVRMY